jgi:hypothetical protein
MIMNILPFISFVVDVALTTYILWNIICLKARVTALEPAKPDN